MGRIAGSRRGAQWVAAAAVVTTAVVVGAVLMTAPPDAYPAADGWVREPGAPESAPRPSGDPSRAAVSAELTAAARTAGLTTGPVYPAAEADGTADCLADWTGDGPADAARLAAVETALEERGWQVVARRGEPVPEVALHSGTWRLVLHNGGLLNTATLIARRTTDSCDEAFRRAEETRGPRG
ncbi:hypothetical protein AB0O42_16765 [Streptomyces sp. NPDC089922]|uniref:hypothetical protein n=1 Tax=Streptomyces sp. NPDC089922 TaxID=3155189 RepID=UPI00344308C5